MRGTCQSEGNFSIFHSDTNDSADTIKWILQQPWSNGEIYQIGASADGIASFELALAPPDLLSGTLKAQFIIFATAEARRTFLPGGAYRLGLIEGWLKDTVPDQSSRCISEVKDHEGFDSFWESVEIYDNKFTVIDWPSVMWAGWYDVFFFSSSLSLSNTNTKGTTFSSTATSFPMLVTRSEAHSRANTSSSSTR